MWGPVQGPVHHRCVGRSAGEMATAVAMGMAGGRTLAERSHAPEPDVQVTLTVLPPPPQFPVDHHCTPPPGHRGRVPTPPPLPKGMSTKGSTDLRLPHLHQPPPPPPPPPRALHCLCPSCPCG